MLLTSAPAAGTAGLSALTATARAALRRACACNRGGNRHLRQLTGACVKRVSCAVLQCRTTDNDRLASLDRCHFHHGAAACVHQLNCRSCRDICALCVADYVLRRVACRGFHHADCRCDKHRCVSTCKAALYVHNVEICFNFLIILIFFVLTFSDSYIIISLYSFP